MKNEIVTAAPHLLGAGITGVYQGTLLVVLVWLSLRMMRRTNAATHHGVWFCTLLMVVSLLVAHCFLGPRAFVPAAVATNNVLLISPEGPLSGTQELPGTAPSALNEPPLAEPLAAGSLLPPADFAAPDWSGDAARTALSAGTMFPFQEYADTAVRAPFSFKKFAEQLANPSPLNFAFGARVLRLTSLFLLGLWLAIAFVRIFWLIGRLAHIRRLKQQAAFPSPQQDSLFRNLHRQLVVNRKVELKVSTANRSAIVLGFLHPVIVVPAGESLTDLEPILRHELAHVRRFDDWFNLIQHFIQAVFFFHPAIWWISKRLSLEREIACDDYVLQQCDHPRTYALLLANLAGRAQRFVPLLAPGASANKSQLQQRIDMILNTNRNRSPRLSKTRLGLIGAAAALVGVAAICGAPRIVLAQNESPPDAPSAPVAPEAAGAPAGGIQDPVPFDSPGAIPRTAPMPRDIAPGPKLKPGGPVAIKVRPVITVRPDAPSTPKPMMAHVIPPTPPAAVPGGTALPPMTPNPPMALAPAVVALSTMAGAAPTAPVAQATPCPPTLALAQALPAPAGKPVAHGRTKDLSLEERLERLEQMVESLMSQQKVKTGHSEFHLKTPGEKGEIIDRQELATLEEFARSQAEIARKQAELAKQQADMARQQWVPKEKEIEAIKENAKREAAQAAEQARRASREMESMMRGDAKRQAQNQLNEATEGARKELEQMRKQHEQLQREMQKLERQIHELERDRDRKLEHDRKQLGDQGNEDEPATDNQPSRKK